MLIEVPHGATRGRHFESTRRRLTGEFPDDLEEFFYVNTDVGSIECARFIARMITSPGEFPELAGSEQGTDSERLRAIDTVLIVRGLVARTFVDLNRAVGAGAASASRSDARTGDRHDGITPGLPAYVTGAEDVETLLRMHRNYQAVAAQAYQIVCGAAGSASSPGSDASDSPDASALILHTYAPRSVDIDSVDEAIVPALRRAYEPAVFATLPSRPDVDLITETVAGEDLAPRALVRAIHKRYADIGIAVAENATYRLHESTMGYIHSSKYPGQVLCMEINRELLADPFTPFAEMSISERKARRMAVPIAAAILCPH
jgi:hypothetical protein